MASQIAKLAKQLPADHARLEIVRFSFGVRQIALASSCRRARSRRRGEGGAGRRRRGGVEGIARDTGRAVRRYDRRRGWPRRGARCRRQGARRVRRVRRAFAGLGGDRCTDRRIGRARPTGRQARARGQRRRAPGRRRPGSAVGDDHLFVLFVGPEERTAGHGAGREACEVFPTQSRRPAPPPEPVGETTSLAAATARQRRPASPSPRRDGAATTGRAANAAFPVAERCRRALRLRLGRARQCRRARTAPSAGRPLATSTGVFISIPTDGSARRSSGARAGAASPSGGRSRARTKRIAIDLSAVAIGRARQPVRVPRLRHDPSRRAHRRPAARRPCRQPATPAPPVLDDASPATPAARR